MRYEEIEARFDSYFKFTEAQNPSILSAESAKFFAQHVATQVEERADKLQAELDALNEKIDKLNVLVGHPIRGAGKSRLCGFGTTITLGGARNWYVGIDGVKRWADNQLACDQ